MCLFSMKNTSPRLILSAVICLSQRLSHACLSSNKPIMVKPRTAHYNSYNVLDVDYPTWITVAILELIHAPKLELLNERIY